MAAGTAAAAAETQLVLRMGEADVEGDVTAPISLEVVLEYSGAPPIGGTFDLLLTGDAGRFTSWSYGSATLDDQTEYRTSPSVTATRISNIGIGSADGLSAPGVIGTVTVTPADPGTVVVEPATSALSPWVALVGEDVVITPAAYLSAEVTFTEASPAPPPAPDSSASGGGAVSMPALMLLGGLVAWRFAAARLRR